MVFGSKKNNAEARSAEIDNEIKAADFFKALLDDATKRLNMAIDTINERDEKIKLLIEMVHDRDVKIKTLMVEIEHLTDELKKFKQLNGKS